jgi:hypothetical protein
MSDGYLDFANSGVGAKLVNMLGLPKPLPLERYTPGQAVIQGAVLMGGGAQAALLPALAKAFKSIGAQTLAHERLPQWVSVANQSGLTTGRWGGAGKGGEKVKALVFDATGLTDSTQSEALYWFFHDAARSLLPCGRVIVLGRPPEGCATPRQATVQRALEGLTRSLGKELKKGSNTQLVYVAEGAEDQIESTLRFLLSPRSAYVSAQVIRIGQVVGASQVPADWQQPLAGKKVLVTGASRGIGAAIAEVMARDGAQVICLDVPQAQAGLDEVAKKIGGTALAMDIGAIDAPKKLVDAAKARGGWDVVVHNAGITRDKTIANMKDQICGRRWSTSTCLHKSASTTHGRVRRAQGGCAHRVCVVHLRHCRQPGPDQLRGLQGRCHRHGAKHGAGAGQKGHHHQCSGPRFHRNPDDRRRAVCDPRSRPPHELHGAGRSTGGCGRGHCLVCVPRVRRFDRQCGARLRPKPDWVPDMRIIQEISGSPKHGGDVFPRVGYRCKAPRFGRGSAQSGAVPAPR